MASPNQSSQQPSDDSSPKGDSISPSLLALVRELVSAGLQSEEIALEVGLSANQLDHRLRLEGTGLRKIATEWKNEHKDQVNRQVLSVIESNNGKPSRELLSAWRRSAKTIYTADDTQRKFVLCCSAVFVRTLAGDRLRSIERETGLGRVMVLSAYDVVKPHVMLRRQEIANGVLPFLSPPTVCERDARAFELVYCKEMPREAAAKELGITVFALNATLERIATKVPSLKGLVIRKAERQDIDTVKKATKERREARLSELRSFLERDVPVRFHSYIRRASIKKTNKELETASRLAAGAPAIEAAVGSSGIPPRLAGIVTEALFYNSAFISNPTGGAIALKELSEFISIQLRTHKIARNRHSTILRKLAYPSSFKTDETKGFVLDKEKVQTNLQQIARNYHFLEKIGATLKIPAPLCKAIAARRMLETRLTPARAKSKIRSDWARIAAVKKVMEDAGYHRDVASGVALSVCSMANPLSSWRTALEKGMNHIERQVRRSHEGAAKRHDQDGFWSTLLLARNGDVSARHKVLLATSDLVTSRHFSIRFTCFGIIQEILFDSPLPPLKENTFVKLISYISLTICQRLRLNRAPSKIERENSDVTQLTRTITSYLLAREYATSSHRFGSKRIDSISRIPIKNLQSAYRAQLRGDEVYGESSFTPEQAIAAHSAAVALRAQAAMCHYLIKACPELSEAALVFEQLALRHRTPEEIADNSGLTNTQVRTSIDRLLHLSPLLSRFFVKRPLKSQFSPLEEGIEDVLVDCISIARAEGAIDARYQTEIVLLALTIPDFLNHIRDYCQKLRLVADGVSLLPINSEGRSMVFRRLSNEALRNKWTDDQVTKRLEELVATAKKVVRFLPGTLDARSRSELLTVLSITLVPSDNIARAIKKVEATVSSYSSTLEREGYPSSVARAVSVLALHSLPKKLSIESATQALTQYERIKIACSCPGWRASPAIFRIHKAWQEQMKSAANVTHDLIEVFAFIDEGDAKNRFSYGFLCELRFQVLSDVLRNPHSRLSFWEFIGYCAAYYRYRLAQEGNGSLSGHRESLQRRFSSSPQVESLGE